MSEAIVHPEVIAPEAVDALRQDVRVYANKVLAGHVKHMQMSMGMACLLAARRRKGLIEVHGIIKNPEYDTLIVESHYDNNQDGTPDPVLPPVEIDFEPDPDAACEHMFMGRTDMLHTQLNTGEAWPAIIPVVGSYRLLRHRLTMLTNDRIGHAYAVKPRAVYPILREMTIERGHRIQHPALRYLIDLPD